MAAEPCIDVIIRLRAEYLWSAERADEIQFCYSCSRESVPWERWRERWRAQIYENDGRETFRWIKKHGPTIPAPTSGTTSTIS